MEKKSSVKDVIFMNRNAWSVIMMSGFKYADNHHYEDGLTFRGIKVYFFQEIPLNVMWHVRLNEQGKEISKTKIKI